MKKFYVFRIMMSVVLAMLLTVGNVFADHGWVQVTYTSNLSVGDTIVIAASTFDKAIGSTQNTNNRAAVDVIKSSDGGMITSIGSAQMFIVQAGNAPGTIAFFDPNHGTNGGYLYAAGTGGNQNYMRTEATLDDNGRGDWLVNYNDDGAIESIVAQTNATDRVHMRYNPNNGNPMFSCYGVNSSIINLVTIYRYEEVEAATVAAPEFSVPQGTYYVPQTVSISCATANATILYTLDGSEPATNGLVYSIPLNITATTTVKAIAFLGTDTSYMSQATYTLPVEVDDIADFKTANTATNTTLYHIAGDVTFVFRSGRYMLVEDASAALMIYDNNNPVITTTYNEGDVISGGVFGSYSLYHGMAEMVPAQNTAEASGNTGAVTPIVATIPTLVSQYSTYECRLVTVQNVTFLDNGKFVNGTDTMVYYDNFNTITDAPEQGDMGSITGFVAIRDGQVRLYPRNNEDFNTAPQPAQPSITVTINGEQFSTLDSLQVDIDIQNFTLSSFLNPGDGYLKLEGELLNSIANLQDPIYMDQLMYGIFEIMMPLTPIPAGTHTVTASLVGVDSLPLNPAVSQSVTFTVTAPVAEAPVFDPAAGPFGDSVVVSLTCATEGAQIRYTLDGMDPVATSALYENPFTLYENTTVKAKAFMNSAYWTDSPVAEAAYTIVHVPTMTVDPTSLTFSASNQYTGTVNIYSAALTDPITITCNDAHFILSDTIFPANVGNTSFTVTFDHQEPAFGSITVSSGNLSAQIDLVGTAQLPVPVITPASGTTDTMIVVEMSNAINYAAIAYTINGDDPNEFSEVYSQPITLNVPGTYTFKAYAYAEGWDASERVMATYTVVAPEVPSIDTIIYTTGFEAEEGFVVNMNDIGAVYNNNYIYYSGTEGQQWGTYYGTPSGEASICGGQSMQMRWYASNPDRLGYTFTNFDLRNVTYVTFNAKQTSGNKLKVSYSIDGGYTYEGDSLYALTTNGHNYRFNVSETGEYNFVRLRFDFVLSDGTPVNKSKVVIDSVVVFGVPGIVVEQVEMPVITPNSDTYYNGINATITCGTAGAVIRYTTDGSEPTVNSVEYTGPIAIDTTTTLKAKAWKEGMEASFVATVTYNFPPEVPNIAAFKAANTGTNNTVYKIAGDVTFVFRSGRYMLVEDASAALMIYDNNNPVITTTYNEGDVISGGVFGSYSLYHGMAEMVPAQNTAEASSNTGAVTPIVATIPTLVSQYSTYECRLVTVQNVTFLDNGKFVNGTDTMVYYDNFNTVDNDPVTGSVGSITGFVAIRDDVVRLYPRGDNDFNIQVLEQVATPEFTPAAGEFENSVEVSLSCATADATIYYTLDGTTPDENATAYNAPFTLTATTTVKAIAVKEGMTNSEVAEATYTITTVGIRNMQQNISIYPNPTSGEVTLDLSGLNAKTVELFSMNGQLLNTVVPTDETMTLSLSNYAAGIYFVRIHSDNAVTTQKIVKR